MSCTKRFLAQFTAVLVALAANACAAPGGRPVASASAAKVACVGGVIRTEADAELYSRCERVNGDLSVVGSQLEELSALSGLRQVSGTLEIVGNSQLEGLSGLEQLERVGKLSIRDNAELDDLSGVAGLRGASSVVVSGNPELASLRGLEGLTRVETLVLEHNGLYQTAGLSNLTEVGSLLIADNAKLNSVQGLRSLSRARSIEIRNNPRLCGRGMLPALTRVEREMTLRDNGASRSPTCTSCWAVSRAAWPSRAAIVSRAWMRRCAEGVRRSAHLSENPYRLFAPQHMSKSSEALGSGQKLAELAE